MRRSVYAYSWTHQPPEQQIGRVWLQNVRAALPTEIHQPVTKSHRIRRPLHAGRIEEQIRRMEALNRNQLPHREVAGP